MNESNSNNIGVCCDKKNAFLIKKFIEKKDWLDKSLNVISEEAKISFPVHDIDEITLKQVLENEPTLKGIETTIVKINGLNKKKKATENCQNFLEWLKPHLSDTELKLVKTSFNTVGDCVIIEVPSQLRHKESLIGESIVATKKGIRVVCRVDGPHAGPFRIQPLKVIAGDSSRPIQANYKESGCDFIINVDEVFFSPRLAGERIRIS
eukprot:c1048_g1_i1.p1 GENE.c1048_g1_i1~~c1048_g1_i1.p1  ORF type:complete len:208 (+),score=70.18 c1048_g1_i1:38-661(+)